MIWRLASHSDNGTKPSFLRSGLTMVACAVALSACNTTGEGEKTKTALFETPSTSQAAVATTATPAATDAAVAAAPVPAVPGTIAVANGQQQPAGSAVAVQTPASGPTVAAAAGAAGALTGVGTSPVINPAMEQATALAMLPDPVLPSVVPIPGSRDEPAAAMAFASNAQSPASLAAGMAFETPGNAPTGLDALIQKYSSTYEVPERLVRRVVHRESRFNPAARNGPYWGLMQISHPTARGMGYTGAPKGLLDAETNLKYAVRYLAGAYKVAGGNENQAVRYYAQGYYYDAKRKGLLHQVGLNSTRTNVQPVVAQTFSAPIVSARPMAPAQ